MISAGTRVYFNWDFYDCYYNTDVEYLGSETLHGTVVDFDDNIHDMNLKKQGHVKVKTDENHFSYNGGFCYPEEKDVKIGEEPEKPVWCNTDNAIEWFRNNWKDYTRLDNDCIILSGNWEDDFKNAMKK